MFKATFIGIDKSADDTVRELTGAVRDATALLALVSDTIPGIAANLLKEVDVNDCLGHLFQSGLVSSRHLLCCVAQNLSVSCLRPCPSRRQYVFRRLNHAGQNVLQEGI